MDVERKIKDMYKCDCIRSDSEMYPLQKWYNELIEKKISEINISDVLKMIRQNEFIEIAIFKTIGLLKNNPFVGELYEGQLLEKISDIDKKYLEAYSKDIRTILINARSENKKHEWLCEDEREEFEQIVEKLLEKI